MACPNPPCIAQSFKIEKALMDSGQFRLPGKKALLESEMEWQVLLVDATETPIERPQKTEKALQRQEKAPHLQGSIDRGER